jgi:arylsulfatase A-like enzyme
MMNSSQFRRALGAMCGVLLLACAVHGEAPKPNILVIVSDDHGYADVGFQGCKDIPTPNLDRLAASGLQCTDGYVSHPYCSPTRAGLMTGRYQQRFGHEHNPFYDPQDPAEGLPLTEKIIPQYLLPAGYVTGWIGKWHLGATPAHHPENRGFKETFGFIGGGHQYQNWAPDVKKEYTVPIERNGQPVEVKEHLTVAFGHEGAAFVMRHRSEPWFLYTAFNAPHTPIQPTPERLARFAGIADPTRRGYAAQVSLLDDAVGEILDAVMATGQDRRTLVFFFSDNGGPLAPHSNGSQNTPLRDGKGSVYEGGIRVPFVVSWPGTLPAGGKYHQPVCSLDVLATTLAAAGVPMPTDKKYDSVNLLPFLEGESKGTPHEQLFWRSDARLAMRDHAAKLVRNGKNPDETYDLANDLGETTDLAASQPGKARQLATELEDWNKQLIPPAFPGAGQRNPPAHKPD